MDGSIQDLVRQVKEHLRTLYGEKIKQVILYGTQIGGEATDASAIDLLVLVDESLDPFDVRTRLGDVLFDILIDAGELISVIVIPEQLFNTYNSPFLLTVKKEGVVA